MFDIVGFSSPCLGILFSPYLQKYIFVNFRHIVFVPMFGDPFFTPLLWLQQELKKETGFRPHVWGFLFHGGQTRKGS